MDAWVARRFLLPFAATIAIGCGDAAPTVPEAIAPEAGFIEIEPVDYQVHGNGADFTATSSRARLFFDFHPADSDAADRPLVVLYSGGPGAATGILLGGNTAPRTVDPARTGDARIAQNPASWTAFANLLHLDARGTGFSYGLTPGASDAATRAAELSFRNFNTFLDAADVVRATLRFLRAHEPLRAARVVLAGESYGGVRTEVALHMLHHPGSYEGDSALYSDPALAGEIRRHFADAGTTAAFEFDRAVLLQGRIASPAQQEAAGAALEAPDSPLHTIAGETGVPFVPCASDDPLCSPFANAVAYLESAGRDLYDVRKPKGDLFARYAKLGERLSDPEVLPEALGADPHDIDAMPPSARADAYRLVTPDPTEDPLAAALGDLAPYDRYFEIELFDLLGAPFAGKEAQSLGIERQHERYGRLFLADLLEARMFVTNALFDAAIWTPSLPEALAVYTSEVASVHTAGETLVVDYVPGAFGTPAGTSRTLRFVTFANSGHSIALDEPDKLSAEIGQWLSETE